MATPDGGGTPPHEPRHQIEILGSESEPSGANNDGSEAAEGHSRIDLDEPIPPVSVCPWRTEQYHDQECSRFYDCPWHVIERYTEDDGEGDTQGDDEGVESDLASHTEEANSSQQGAVAPEAAATGSHLNPTEVGMLLDPVRQESSARSTPAADRDAEREAGPSNLVLTVPSSTSGVLPVTAAPPQAQISRSRPGEIVLPRWQPDSEVTYCPICHTQFSIFVRKHHCRKCGRVVCNACSPHRITIPYQYIVKQPGYSPLPTQRYPPLPGNEGFVDFNSLGGGERVRLCNPCVPDPNTAPPQTQDPGPRGHQRSSSSLLSPGAYSSAGPNRYGPYVAPSGDPFARNRSITMQSGASSSSQSSRGPYRGPPIFGGTPPAYFPSGSSSSHQRTPHAHAPVTNSRYYDTQGRGGASVAGSSSMVDRSLPPLPQQQIQLAEDDECPVCHRELPRRSLPNFEALREAHINICITAHSTYGSPSAGGIGSDGDDEGAPLPRIPPRTTRMFPYVATEKDCVDSAECSICLEEFEVGVPMARLECLCRFHRHCIRAWWERHPGRCPMHQHDSYGY